MILLRVSLDDHTHVLVSAHNDGGLEVRGDEGAVEAVQMRLSHTERIPEDIYSTLQSTEWHVGVLAGSLQNA